MKTRIVDGGALINEIAEILIEADYEFIEDIANKVLAGNVSYVADDMYEIEEKG